MTNYGMTLKHSRTSRYMWCSMSYFNRNKSAKEREEESTKSNITMGEWNVGEKGGLDRQRESQIQCQCINF